MKRPKPQRQQVIKKSGQLLLNLLPLLVFFGGAALAAESKPQIYVPDGQLLSHVFRVFVTHEITSEMEPQLHLDTAHIFLKPDAREKRVWIGRAIPRQHWRDTIDGQTVQLEGTLLLFDLKEYPIPFLKPAVRVIPSLSWKDPVGTGGEQRILIGQDAIYLASLGHALLLTLVLLGLVILMISRWARRKSPKNKAIMLICGPDGFMSLWRTQLAAWTVAVGAMVFCFGMIRLAVPQIPETLVALMGMSLLTGGVSAAKSQSNTVARETKNHKPITLNKGRPALEDLIGEFDSKRELVQLSLPKAQMAFWTILMLVLFVGKTLVEGQLWDIPWQLVALTGFSQAGYIGGKYSSSPATEPKQDQQK